MVARKLGRHFLGIECEEEYALLAEKRLDHAKDNAGIQGYSDGVFWERNSLNAMNGKAKQNRQAETEPQLLL